MGDNAETNAYLEKHDLAGTISTLIAETLKKQPANPYKALGDACDKLAKGYSGSAPKKVAPAPAPAAAEEEEGGDMGDFLDGIADGEDEAAAPAPAPGPSGPEDTPGTDEWKARCRRAGVPEDCEPAKLAFAEHGTKIRGESTGKLNDDLPSEEEDDGDGMGDFVADIGGGDDY